MAKDESTGRHYFINHADKTTSWIDPRPVPILTRRSQRQLDITRVDSKEYEFNVGTKKDDGTTDLEWYEDLLKLSLTDRHISSEEKVLLANVRRKRRISQGAHTAILTKLGYSQADIDNLDVDKVEDTPKECVVCLDSVATHVILDCMHLCLCEGCAPAVKKLKKVSVTIGQRTKIIIYEEQ